MEWLLWLYGMDTVDHDIYLSHDCRGDELHMFVSMQPVCSNAGLVRPSWTHLHCIWNARPQRLWVHGTLLYCRHSVIFMWLTTYTVSLQWVIVQFCVMLSLPSSSSCTWSLSSPHLFLYDSFLVFVCHPVFLRPWSFHCSACLSMLMSFLLNLHSCQF